MTVGTGTTYVVVPLAHQGGWDELLVVLVPLLLLVGLLVLATRRVNAKLEDQPSDDGPETADAGTPPADVTSDDSAGD